MPCGNGTVGHPDRSRAPGSELPMATPVFSAAARYRRSQSVALERAAAIPDQPAPGAALDPCLSVRNVGWIAASWPMRRRPVSNEAAALHGLIGAS